MKIEGSGPSLIDASPWLRDPAERHRRILDVAERNSVIEGLPPFTDETREKIRSELESLSVPAIESAPAQ
jgi:hypothetical protein